MSKIEEVQNTVKATPGLGKKMAKYGAIGAVVAIPVPFIGPVLGALAGAGIAYARRDKI
ncbi:small multi-drug export protein [Sphingomonas sp. TZW2008]|uniref:small multi-drug export protein n=1 Tax=Sphingomonas sp. TZW2008 TaxID=1917973 RepID=UPI0015C50B6F|nr:small multi-drug export protein [Sphingomonas sp. TZW2008]